MGLLDWLRGKQLRATLTTVRDAVIPLTEDRLTIVRTEDPKLIKKIGPKVAIKIGTQIISCSRYVSRTPKLLEWDPQMKTYRFEGRSLKESDEVRDMFFSLNSVRLPRATLSIPGGVTIHITEDRLTIVRTQDEKMIKKIGVAGVIKINHQIISISPYVSRTPKLLEWDPEKNTYKFEGKPLQNGDKVRDMIFQLY